MSYSVVRLPGGLGNQLFALFAARYISQETGSPSHLDFGGIDYSHHNRKIDISNFILESQEELLSKNASLSLRALKMHFLHQSKVLINNKFRNFAKNLNYFSWDVGSDFRQTVDETLVGLKDRKLKLPISFYSYFADFSYFDLIKDDSLKTLRLKVESDHFLKLSEATRAERILGVHLRLGDFLQNSNTIGCLSDIYFIDAIEQAFESNKYDQVWVFTDSVDIALERVKNWPHRNRTKIIGNMYETNACEELLLLSMCAGIVCSNSTFSYWGAKFASSQNMDVPVFFPEFFRRDNLTFINNIPSVWIPMTPVWRN